MKCLDDHHTYELDHVMEPTAEEQAEAITNSFSGEPIRTSTTLRFYEMRVKKPKSFKLGGEKIVRINGVTNEEVLRVLIHRLTHLNKGKFECQANSEAIYHLEKALYQLKDRTRDRQVRKVEGTLKP